MVFARSGDTYVARELPSPDEPLEAIGTSWGKVEELCTPAYWAAQAWMWEIEEPNHYKLGRTLEEELIACLLGGYGAPAEIGMAAYHRLQKIQQTDPLRLHDEKEIFDLLSTPLTVGGRSVRYRFAQQRARYLSGALRGLQILDLRADDRLLRDQLTELPGIGPKTASWIVRNWRDSDKVSILDIHIMRAGRILDIFPEFWTVERHYYKLEDAFLNFAEAISVRASILDSVMWMNMRQLSKGIVRNLIDPQSVQQNSATFSLAQMDLTF